MRPRLPGNLKRCPAGLLCLLYLTLPGALAAKVPATGIGAAPRQQFIAPAAGSYVLHAIQRAPAGRVLGSDGRGYDFARFSNGRITLLSFIYTYCSDPTGCPLAFTTLHGLRERLLATPALARRVRFVSLSFDSTHDTPEAMRLYGGPLAHSSNLLEWHFLTTASLRQLTPLVDGFGQSVQVQRDSQGRPSRLYNHMLKMFLLDAQGRVREIYSTAFLQPEVMLNDIKTLAMENAPGATVAARR